MLQMAHALTAYAQTVRETLGEAGDDEVVV